MKILTVILLALILVFVFECAVSLHSIALDHSPCFMRWATWINIAKTTKDKTVETINKIKE